MRENTGVRLHDQQRAAATRPKRARAAVALHRRRQIHIANSCTCFSCATLIRTMRYNAAGAQLPRAPDRTLGYAILFALPFSPKHIGALRVHEFRFQKISTFSKLSAKFRQISSTSEQKSVKRIQK